MYPRERPLYADRPMVGVARRSWMVVVVAVFVPLVVVGCSGDDGLRLGECPRVSSEATFAAVGEVLVNGYPAIRQSIDGSERRLDQRASFGAAPEDILHLSDRLTCDGVIAVVSFRDSGGKGDEVGFRLFSFRDDVTAEAYRLSESSWVGLYDTSYDGTLEKAKTLRPSGSPPSFTVCYPRDCHLVNVVVLSERCFGLVLDVDLNVSLGADGVSLTTRRAVEMMRVAEAELAAAQMCRGEVGSARESPSDATASSLYGNDPWRVTPDDPAQRRAME